MSSKDIQDTKKTTDDVVVGDGSDPELAARIDGDNVEGQQVADVNAGQEGDDEYNQNM